MKKCISLLLLLCLTLGLCACSGTGTGTAAGTGNEIAEEITIEIPPTAITLQVSFGPEFKLVMTDYLRILAAIPANEEAKVLLAGLDLTDRSYRFAFDEVLAAAQEQGLLKAGVTLKMTAQAQDPSVWNNASKELLMQPVDAFRAETGALFGCYLLMPENAADPFDYSQYTKAERTTEEGSVEFYPTGAQSGFTHWRSVSHYSDGRIEEWYAFAIKGGSITITRNPDGSCIYSQANDHFRSKISDIWEGPDGWGYREITGKANLDTGEYLRESESGFDSTEGGFYFARTYNPDGTMASNNSTFLDGSCESVTFYSSGEIHTKEYTGANGNFQSAVFFENGNVEHIKNQTAEGYYEEQRTEDGSFLYQKFTDPGPTNVREVFYTDGKPVKVIIDGVVHEDREILRQFG